ncbi:MAG: SWIM zinc finger family protein [Acidimicrobiia bacterium]
MSDDPNALEPNDPNRISDPNLIHDPNVIDQPAPKRRRSRRRSRSGKKGPRPAEQAAAPRAPDEPPAASEGAQLLASSLQEAVLRHTSAAVLGRGTGYAKRNRVSELRVSAGRIRGRVRGSGDQRYRVELTVPQRPAPARITKIRWSCDCPYAAEHRRGTCKHVVALALVAAKRIEKTEAMHLRWLGQPAANAAEAAPAEVDALAERLMAAFTAEPVSVGDVLVRSLAIAPPPFDVPAH